MESPTGPLHALTLAAASELIRRRSLSPVELMQAVLARAEATEPLLHAYTWFQPEVALRQARQAEAEIARGDYRGALHGIPFNLKDLYYTTGIPTEAGSRLLKGFVPDWEATVAARMRQAGALLVGKTVTNEFGLGFNTVPTLCPWRLDLECHPGGSSAGAAASVAAGSSLAAFGTDTGGSIRVPGAINGLTALKPTYGRVSRHGIVPLSHSLDHPGLIGRTAEDVAWVLNAVGGHDGHDPVSSRRPMTDNLTSLRAGVRGLRLGVERDYFFRHARPEVLAGFDRAVAELEAQGAELVEVNLAALETASSVALTILLAEGGARHQRWLRARGEEYDPATRINLVMGALIPARDYLRAVRLRTQFALLIRQIFEIHRLDALLVPTLPGPTLTRREIAAAKPGSEDLAVLGGYFANCVPFNLTGQPALTVPCGFSERGLPIGLQIVGRPFQDDMTLRIGWAYQAVTDWHNRRPDLSVS